MLLPLICLFLSFASGIHAQDPVHWNFNTISTKDGETVRLTATIDPGWHIYAMTQPPEAISEPTKIQFQSSPLFRFTGELKEGGRKETYTNKEVGITQFQYRDSVTYTRAFLLRGSARTTITGTITYQACTDEQCLPPKTIPFSVAIP